MADEAPRGPGRPPRVQQERQQRRRRGDAELRASSKLPIPPEIEARLKAEGRTPRWVNDTGTRIQTLTQADDYDKVEGVEPVPVVIDRKTGETALAHLLSKPTAFIEEDRADAERRRKAKEEALFTHPEAAGKGRAAGGAEMYLDKATKIGRAEVPAGNGTNQILGD